MKSPGTPTLSLRTVGIGIGAIIVFLFALNLIFANNVAAGAVGVVTTWGKVEPGTLDPGFHIVIPVAQQIHNVNTRVQNQQFSQIDAATRELQSVKIDGKVRYTVDAPHANQLYQKVGTEDIEARLIDPDLQTFLKEVTVNYNAFCSNTADGKQVDASCKSLINSRAEIGDLTLKKVQSDMAQYGIDVSAVLIQNVAFSADFEKAIEAKQTAAQQVETAKQVQSKAQIDAQTALIEAQGKANANNAEKVSLTAELLEKLAIEKWDGHLPTTYVAGGASPFFDVFAPKKAQ